MSKRELTQVRLAEWLLLHQSKFTAPYGVIVGLKKTGRGKIRTITFGCCRSLDATIEIWSPTLIRIKAAGPLAYKVEGQFDSANAVIEHLEKL